MIERNNIRLSLTITTEEVQSLIKEYLESLDGWELVPKEATEEMYLAFCLIRNDIELGEFREAYSSIIESAPKYTGEN